MEDQDQIIEQLNRAKSFLMFRESDAGKLMIVDLEQDIDRAVDKLVARYRDASHIELTVTIANIESLKNLLQELNSAKEKVEILTNELKTYVKSND